MDRTRPCPLGARGVLGSNHDRFEAVHDRLLEVPLRHLRRLALGEFATIMVNPTATPWQWFLTIHEGFTELPLLAEAIRPESFTANEVPSGSAPPSFKASPDSRAPSPSLILGRRRLTLGEVVEVERQPIPASPSSAPPQPRLVLRGDWSRVRGIGRGMRCGQLIVEGDAGAGVGADMSGGTLEVLGHAGSFAGAGMSGGTLRIHGNAGDDCAGAWPGADQGMSGGWVFVGGRVGARAGRLMRRGHLVIQGDADQALGWEMIAGSIVVLGRCGPLPGAGMKRGTLLLAQGTDQLPPTFARVGPFWSPVLTILLRDLAQRGAFAGQPEGFADHLARRGWVRFNGDRLHHGLGELYLPHDPL